MIPTIIFHIGLERTGTSSFQRFCTENSAALLDRGILYPTSGLAFGRCNHAPLAACYLPYRDLNIAPRRPRAAVVGALREQIDRLRPRTVLVSSEHLSSRFHDAEILNLARDFADYRCRIVVVVREHEARLRSAYASAVRSGERASFEEFCTIYLDHGSRYIRCLETIEPWERAFGRDVTQVLAAASGIDMVDALRRALIPAAAELTGRGAIWDNGSLPASALEVLRRVNLALPAGDALGPGLAGHLGWFLRRAAHDHAFRQIAKTARARPRDDFPMVERIHMGLAKIAERDREWLATRHGVQLEAPRGRQERAMDDEWVRTMTRQIASRPLFRLLRALKLSSL